MTNLLKLNFMYLFESLLILFDFWFERWLIRCYWKLNDQRQWTMLVSKYGRPRTIGIWFSQTKNLWFVHLRVHQRQMIHRISTGLWSGEDKVQIVYLYLLRLYDWLLRSCDVWFNMATQAILRHQYSCFQRRCGAWRMWKRSWSDA